MKPYHRNPRTISKKNFTRLEDTMNRLGDLGGIVHNLETDEIIGGNQRARVFGEASSVEIVQTLDTPDEQGTIAHGFIVWRGHKFAYRQVRWTDDIAAEANIRANIGAGDWDWTVIANEWTAEQLKGFGMDDDLLKTFNLDGVNLREMLTAEQGGDADAEPQVDRAEELNKKWQVATGDLWRIGEHRLLCGDSTKREDVERVMGNERATLAPVDPPYNVGFGYDGETVDDKKTADIYEQFSRNWFMECQRVSIRQIVTPGCYNLASWLQWFNAFHWAPWTKSNSMTNGKVSRFWCWEPVLFFGDKWKRTRNNDIFDYPIGMQKDVANHPCPKPLKMWEDLIENYSEVNDVIYECFGGSGTTLVACQNLSRKCRAIEISPAYCAVILQRMADAFPCIVIERV